MIVTDCRLSTPGELVESLPDSLVSLQDSASQEAVDSLVTGEKLYYGDDVDKGEELLSKGWALLVDRPHLLPRSKEERSRVYSALQIVLRIAANQSMDRAGAMYEWLALHMPDQVPSVQELPPVLAAGASEAVERTRKSQVTLTAPAPQGCSPDGKLFIDGLQVGRLPISGQPVAAGKHRVWFECDGQRSWVRELDLTCSTELKAPDLSVESVLLLHPRGMAISPAAHRDRVKEVGLRMVASFGTDGVVLVPRADEQTASALLFTAYGMKSIKRDKSGFTIEGSALPRSIRKTAGKWVLLGLTSLSLSCGLTANYVYNGKIARMDSGTVDTRDEAASWRYSAWGLYGGAALALGTSVILFILDRPTPRPEPLF